MDAIVTTLPARSKVGWLDAHAFEVVREVIKPARGGDRWYALEMGKPWNSRVRG